jgi:NDP-sugar pyrophosphorylase family protein
MKAMILAAGLGTRLRPLTDTRPKALVELSGRTLLEITLIRLRTFGVTEVIINVHHFADMVTDYLKSNKNFGLRIEISREEVLLDTGGGLKKAAWFFLEDSARPNSSQIDEPFLLHNVDVISNIDLNRMFQFHTENQALATLAVQSRQSSRPLLFDNQNQLRGRRIDGKDTLIPIPSNTAISSEPRPLPLRAPFARRNLSSIHLQPLAFSGIHIISPQLLPMLTEEGIFSIIPSYLRLSAQGQKILAFRADQYYWRDLGRPADLAQAAHDLQQNALL